MGNAGERSSGVTYAVITRQRLRDVDAAQHIWRSVGLEHDLDALLQECVASLTNRRSRVESESITRA